MKTIEIQQTEINKNKRLMKLIFKKYLSADASFHFLFEPKLIIRIDDQSVIRSIAHYLYKRKIDFKVYPYPFPKNGYGEGRRGVTAKYNKTFISMLHYSSLFALTTKTNEQYKVLERIIHTTLNTYAFEWFQETRFFQRLSYGRLRTILKYERLSPINWLYIKLLTFITRINFNLHLAYDTKT